MRFSPATLLLAPALVSANNIFFSNGEDAWLGDRAPSADIRLLSLSPTLAEERDLTFRLDVLESEEACGYANITINGAPLADRHRGVLTLDHGVIVLANWRFECMIWRGVESEQLMFLDIESVNDQAVSDMGFAIRFRQSEPMWLTDIQGQASIITPNSKTNDDDIPLDDGPFLDEDEDDEYEYEDEDGEEGSKLEQALAEIASLQAQVEDLMDELSFTHEQMAELIERREREQRVRGCDSVRCYIKAITNKFSGHRLPADGEFHITSVLDPSDTDAEGGPHKGHWPPKFRFPHHGHGNHTHGNHTHGNHTFPHRPPFWCRLPRHPPFKHRPPFGRHPPPHHKPPHGKPPHGKPPHGKPPHGKHPHDNPPHDKPPHGKGPLNGDAPWPWQKQNQGEGGPRNGDGPWPCHKHGEDGSLHLMQCTPIHRDGGIPTMFKISMFAFLSFAVIRIIRRHHGGGAEQRAARREACRQRRVARRAGVRGFFGRVMPFGRYHQQQQQQQGGGYLGLDVKGGDGGAVLPRYRDEVFDDHHDEKKGIVVEEGGEAEELSMAGEIASFRTVADLVGDMVAAEQRRVVSCN